MTNKNPTISSHPTVLQEPTPPIQDNEEFEFNGFEVDEPMEKDPTELELEKLVFGDQAGFREKIQSYQSGGQDLDRPDAEAQAIFDEDLDASLDNADIFTFDAEPSKIQASSLVLSDTRDEDGSGKEALAWVDSDDERIVVSLASNPRLRKLRLTETEDLVNGKEYTKRLRQQYQRLHPMPDWAKQCLHKDSHRSKRQRRSASDDDADSSDSDVASDDSHISVSSSTASTKPLISLLHGISGLLHSASPAKNRQSTKIRALLPSTIQVHRLKDVGSAQPSLISCIEFHPIHPLLLSSGPSALMSLHHISPSSSTPNPNPLVTSLHLRGVPLSSTTFLHPTGDKIYCSGRRRYFHIWDLPSGKVEKVSHALGTGRKKEAGSIKSLERFKLSPCGRYMGVVGSRKQGGGSVEILDASTCQWIGAARVEGRGGVADFEWWGDGEGMLVLGKGGEAVEWDGRTNEVVARWVDEGAVGTTVVALGGSSSSRSSGGRVSTGITGPDRWVAVGSSTGIVNIYDRREWSRAVSTNPKPKRVLGQLGTAISHLKFSPDGQVLCMASRWKRDALRLIHLPSCTIYKNWPTSGTPLGRITAVAWTRNSEVLAVGNEQGKIRLWEIRP